MSSFYYGAQQHHGIPAHSGSHGHHGGRSRRAARFSGSNHHNKMRSVRQQKEALETVHVIAFQQNFEAARSFDIEDDEMFCPFYLLTDDDLQSIHSSGSDRSSLSSGSPDHSPLQHQLQPTPTFTLSSASSSYTPVYPSVGSTTKIHQPLAQRSRNPIPIVDPSTRSVASPPPSVSPARQIQQQLYQRSRW